LRGLKSRFFVGSQSSFNALLDEICKGVISSIVPIGAVIWQHLEDPLIFFQEAQRPAAKSGGPFDLCRTEPVQNVLKTRCELTVGITKWYFFEMLAISDHCRSSCYFYPPCCRQPFDHGFPELLSQLGSPSRKGIGSLWDRF